MSPIVHIDYDSEDEIRRYAFVYFFPIWPLNALIRIYNFNHIYENVKSQAATIFNHSGLEKPFH